MLEEEFCLWMIRTQPTHVAWRFQRIYCPVLWPLQSHWTYIHPWPIMMSTSSAYIMCTYIPNKWISTGPCWRLEQPPCHHGTISLHLALYRSSSPTLLQCSNSININHSGLRNVVHGWLEWNFAPHPGWLLRGSTWKLVSTRWILLLPIATTGVFKSFICSANNSALNVNENITTTVIS